MAQALAISVGTVLKAHRELELEGLTEGRLVGPRTTATAYPASPR